MAITTPDRTTAQRQEALRLANAVRVERAKLKRDLKAGRRLAVDVIADPPEWALTMRIFDVLMALPRFGRTTVLKTMSVSDVSLVKTLGGLTPRQRKALAQSLRLRAGVSG